MHRIANRRLAAWALLSCLITAPVRAGEPVWLVDLYAGLPGHAQSPAQGESGWRIGLGGAALPALGYGPSTVQLGPIASLSGGLSLFAGPSLSFAPQGSAPAMFHSPDPRLGLAAGGNLRLNPSITLNTAMGWLRRPIESQAASPRAGEDLFVGTIGLGLRF